MNFTLLHIGPKETRITVRSEARGDAVSTLALGARSLAEAFFRHDPPTALSLEHAIAAVEDEIMRPRALPSGDSTWATRDDALRALADAAGLAGSGVRVLTREVVEQMFQRLASASLGTPSALLGMPAGREAAAVLLILRELMQHRGIASISVDS